MDYKKLAIKEDFIRLDSAMKLAGLVSTGGHAKLAVQGREVKVNGEICLQRGRKLHRGDTAEYGGFGFVIE